jgi:hypothetical protein
MTPTSPLTPSQQAAASAVIQAATGAPLNALQSLSNLRSTYTPTSAHFRGIVLGDKGAGKTTLLATCPRPVLGAFFDPDGQSVLMDVKVHPDGTRETTVPDWLYPVTAYQTLDASAVDQFEQDLRDWTKAGIWPRIGTFVLDSATTLGDCVVAKVLAESAPGKAANRKDKLEIQDYGTIADKTQRIFKTLLNLPTNVLVLGHVQQDTDELTQRLIYNMLYPGQKTSQKLPIYFSEAYYLLTEDAGVDPKTKQLLPATRKLLTTTDGRYKASTRLGAQGRFSAYERPDIRALMAKAGLPVADKPLDISA